MDRVGRHLLGCGTGAADLRFALPAEIAFDGGTPSAPDLDRFRIDRPILLEAAPATSWMV